MLIMFFTSMRYIDCWNVRFFFKLRQKSLLIITVCLTNYTTIQVNRNGMLYFICLVRAICQDIVSGIQPLQNLKVLKKLGGAATDEAKEWGHFWIDEGFKGDSRFTVVWEVEVFVCQMLSVVLKFTNQMSCSKQLTLSFAVPGAGPTQAQFICHFVYFNLSIGENVGCNCWQILFW